MTAPTVTAEMVRVEFSAKRVKPPAPGVSRRITVQIDPAQPVFLPRAPVEIVTPEPMAPHGTGGHDWFWDRISPTLDASGPGRLQQAFDALAGAAGGVAAPRLQMLQEIARAHGTPILRATVGRDVSPALVLAMIAVESAGRADAVSHAGAAGLMQLMPATAQRFGVGDRLQPDQNITGGVKYIDWLLDEFGNDPILALAGYNAGEGAVRAHDGVPPFAETRGYVPKVLAAFRVASALCATPPELISDGCVFRGLN
nr:lytic transglycosylase domain-containing protein [Pukyongiella litopenaei]